MRNVDPNNEILAEFENEMLDNEDEQDEHPNVRGNNEETRRGELIKDSIAAHMWDTYIE